MRLCQYVCCSLVSHLRYIFFCFFLFFLLFLLLLVIHNAAISLRKGFNSLPRRPIIINIININPRMHHYYNLFGCRKIVSKIIFSYGQVGESKIFSDQYVSLVIFNRVFSKICFKYLSVLNHYHCSCVLNLRNVCH